MGSYIVSKEEPITVYGGGPLGVDLSSRLIDLGYNVTAIFDINPEGVENAPTGVMSAEDYYASLGDSFVVIALADGLKHFNIAKTLNKIGFTRILCLPLFLGTGASRRMIHTWNNFYGGGFCVEIPEFDDLWCVKLSDYILLDDGLEFVVVVVHKDVVHTSIKESTNNPFEKYIRWYPEHGEWMDNEVPAIHNVAIDTTIVREHISRTRPYSDTLSTFLENALFNPEHFFLEYAASAMFNREGYFNLFDGGHRCDFLVRRGFVGIPLRVKRTDWETYFKEREAQALMDYCKNIDSLPLSIKHPAFIRFPVENREPDKKFEELYKELCTYEMDQ